jgi:hypothetical protein
MAFWPHPVVLCVHSKATVQMKKIRKTQHLSGKNRKLETWSTFDY